MSRFPTGEFPGSQVYHFRGITTTMKSAQCQATIGMSAFWETLASRVTGFRIGASVVEGLQAAGAFGGALFPLHIQREPLLQMLFGPDAVDAVLRLAEAPVRPLHRVARRSEQSVVQEHQ